MWAPGDGPRVALCNGARLGVTCQVGQVTQALQWTRLAQETRWRGPAIALGKAERRRLAPLITLDTERLGLAAGK